MSAELREVVIHTWDEMSDMEIINWMFPGYLVPWPSTPILERTHRVSRQEWMELLDEIF